MNLTSLSIGSSRARFLTLVAIVACLFGVPCNTADTRIYLEIKGVPGDVTDRPYQTQIAVVSYELPPLPAGGGSMTLTKHVDSSSSILALFAATGEAIKRAILRVVQVSDGKTESKLTIDMRNVLISSYQVGGNSTDGVPVESVGINFAKMDQHYRSHDKKGRK